MVISVWDLIRIFIVLLYVPICGFAYWRLIPRLSPPCKRLATILLVSQILVTILSLQIQPSSDFERWLWDLNMENNIPASLASIQLALVSGVALLTAWQWRTGKTAQRFYLVVIGVLFLFLSLDEWLRIHEAQRILEVVYVITGMALAALAGYVAIRSPRHSWIWYACLLAGLALAGFGGIILEQARFLQLCGSLGPFWLSECLEPYYYEEVMEYLGIWLALVAVLGQFSDAVRAPANRVRGAFFILLSLSSVMLFLTHPIHNWEVVSWAKPASVQFQSRSHLYGFGVGRGGEQISLVMHLPQAVTVSETGYTIHLIDQITGTSIASRSAYLNRKDKVSKNRHDFRPLYRQIADLSIPSESSTNRALWLALSLWREEDGRFIQQMVLSSDHHLLNDTQVVLGELVLPAVSPAPLNAPLAIFDSGFTLESADFPERAQVGDTLGIPFTWRSDAEGLDDLSQFLHFVHTDSGEWWGYDQSPLGARLPTRLWYSGLADSEIWTVPVPDDLAPGQYSVFTGLYRSSDQERIPATDAEGTPWLDNRVALGSLIIE